MDGFIEILQYLGIFMAGILVGGINSVAGGGSIIILPLLIFGFGMEHQLANGTNRISVMSMNIAALMGFRSKGVSNMRYASWLAVAALPGVFAGAFYANHVDREVFDYLLGAIMVGMMIILIVNPFKDAAEVVEKVSKNRLIASIVAFFFIGFYVGFIQAASGFLIIMALTLINRFDLSKTNSIKVFVIAVGNVVALSVFLWQGNVHWLYGIVLAMGTSSGAWLGSRWSVSRGKEYVRYVLMFMIVVSALKLFGVIDMVMEAL